MKEIFQRVQKIKRADLCSMRKMRGRLNNLTKPLGSLGLLEDAAIRIAGITGSVSPKIDQKAIVIMSGDHGVAAEGVSAYPQEVTGLMLKQFASGKAAINVLAGQAGAEVMVVDVGSLLPNVLEGIIDKKVRAGTANMAEGPAMTVEEAGRAIQVGIDIADELVNKGYQLIGMGEMGIGNTTPSVAITSVLTGRSPKELTGRGTGIDNKALFTKAEIISRAIQMNRPNPLDPIDVLAKIGGLEIAGLTGLIIGAASRRIPIVLDGVITGAAALLAARIEPRCCDFMVASHLSVEPAHKVILNTLGLHPLLQAEMCLGEGTGAALVFPLLQSAIHLVERMGTFSELGLPSPAPAEEENSLAPVKRSGHLSTNTTPKMMTEATQKALQHAFTESERAAVYKAIELRRDIRHFRQDPVPDEVLHRLLRAAHSAPSVGFMQPWNFIIITSEETKRRLKLAADKERRALMIHYEDEKAERFSKLKIEGLVEAPVTICVTLDPTRGGPHVLGRNSIPETDLASVSCAIQNLWLAGRAEGIAIGWVSFYKKQDIRQILNIPPHIDPVALLSLGYTDEFPDTPILEQAKWRKRLSLDDLIFKEVWGNLQGNSCMEVLTVE
jgi:nicotinate-nucleotide--dimethylbenzimidazole phosphoribosyltransferase